MLTARASVPTDGELQRLPLGARVLVKVDLPPENAEVVIPRQSINIMAGRSYVETPSLLGWKDVDVQLVSNDDLQVAVKGLPAGTQVRVRE